MSTMSAAAGRGSLLMASGTFVSRGLGMVRNVLLVAALGATGPIANAFDIANKIPNILFALLASGLINAVLVPQIVRAMRTENAQEYLDKLLTAAMAVVLVATLACTLAAPALVKIYLDSSWTPAQVSLAVAFAYWCIPQLFFYGLYAILGQVLNARSQFGPYMWSPVLNNIISIVGFAAFIVVYGRVATDGGAADLAAWTTTKTVWIGAIATVGVVSQAVVLFVPLRRAGFRWHLRFGVRGIGLRTAGVVSLWIILATLVNQIGVWWTTRIATAAPQAAVDHGFTGSLRAIASNSAYTQAQLLYLLPHSLVTVSVATALFTGMSKAAAERDYGTVRAHLSAGLRVVGVFTVIATSALVVLAGPLLKATVPSMDADEITATVPALQTMAFGLIPLGAMVLMKWVYFAFEDGRTVFLMELPGCAILILASWLGSLLLPGQYWVAGIGAAIALSNVVIVAGRARGLSRLVHGLDGLRVARLYVRTTIGAVVAAGVGWFVVRALGFASTSSWGHALVVCALAGGAMVVVYAVCLRMMRVREAGDLVAPFARRAARLVRRG